MNQPGRYEKFIIPEGHKKVTYTKDTKVQNAATVMVEREDHTIGNIVRMQLHLDPDVVFAGYRIPHPLEHKLEFKVHTNGKITPLDAVSGSLTDLQTELKDIRQQFQDEVDKATSA
eukprot:CAMPEP_0117677866 /NCGR_PEP_ID=MMETSP0804-20121206/16971_1 /TAXON_ID=1074897 /ORGANISM="Tetraselmis astigmatica, Strain CCMP880" /LENGTH=115 /DNA_ID=CAMNT_0005487173 /DNA_START=168 /DNA_END=512 /DNA_ORIENTATION=+